MFLGTKIDLCLDDPSTHFELLTDTLKSLSSTYEAVGPGRESEAHSEGEQLEKGGSQSGHKPRVTLTLRQISGEQMVHGQACSGCAFQVQRKLTSTETKFNVKSWAANWILFPTILKCICKYPPRVHNEEKLVSRADSGTLTFPG